MLATSSPKLWASSAPSTAPTRCTCPACVQSLALPGTDTRYPQATYDEQPQGDAPRSQLLMMLLVMFVTFVLPSFLTSFDEPLFSLRQQG